MVIKQYNNFIDIFTDYGWNNHTRFVKKNNTLSFVKGKTLSKENFLTLKQELKKRCLF